MKTNDTLSEDDLLTDIVAARIHASTGNGPIVAASVRYTDRMSVVWGLGLASNPLAGIRSIVQDHCYACIRP